LPCMSGIVHTKGTVVPEPASENGHKARRRKPAPVGVIWQPESQRSPAVSRRHAPLAAAGAAGQRGRFVTGGSTSHRSTWAPGLPLVQLEPLKEPLSSHRKEECTMPANAPATYVGLDIAKARLEYTLDEHRTTSIANTATGHARLIRWLKSQPNVRVVCEATGGYERAVVAALLASGLEVCLVQPGRARAYAHAEGLLAKNDPIDAQMLRRYGQAVKLRLVAPTDPVVARLRELLDQRRDLVDRLVEVGNQRQQASAVRAPWIEREQRFLEQELAALARAIAQHIDDDPTLRQKHARLQQMAGVGPILASTLLAYVPELGCVGDATLSALVGVAPFAADSGPRSCPRHVRGGRAAVRHVLYMAAVAAVRSNRVLAAFYQRLRAAGKPPKVCIVAVMRKMLTVLNRLIAKSDFVLAD
jgi:transposase